MKHIGLFFFCALLLQPALWAQKGEAGRFTAEAVAGVNLAQIDGDNSAGYNKIGLSVGMRGGFMFNKKLELNTEILFSQKGSRSSINEPNIIRYNLQYVEVPIGLTLKDWEITDKDGNNYMRASATANLMFSRLVNGKIEINGFEETVLLDNLRPWDFAAGVTGRIFFTRHWGLELRWSRSLVSMSKMNRTIGHMITIRAVYAF
jgi:hypothetical protein